MEVQQGQDGGEGGRLAQGDKGKPRGGSPNIHQIRGRHRVVDLRFREIREEWARTEMETAQACAALAELEARFGLRWLAGLV